MEYLKIEKEFLYWGSAMVKRIFDGNYLIDEYGNIFSLKSNKYLKPYVDKDGYLAITKYEKGNRKHYKIHRLVAEAFIDNTNNKPCIDHIDRNRMNNYYKNLRYVTPKENSNNINTIKHLKQIGKKYKTEYGKRILNVNGKVYISIIDASRLTCIPRSTIQYHLKNKTGVWNYA